MAPRIVIIGGGSYQWVPKLLVDMVNTPSLANAELVLEDIDPEPLEPMADFVRHGREQVHPLRTRPAPSADGPARSGGVVVQGDGQA